MATLHLKIVTPEQLFLEEDVEAVNVQTSEGELGILPHHANLMARLSPGELRIKKGSKEDRLASGGGFLQMVDNNLTIMTDLAVSEENINEKAVEEALKRAQEALKQKQTLSDEEYATTLAIIEKSAAQLKIKRRHRKNY
ncbi:ATP synthase F1 subunit epsilon [Candidatus Daviesbacteria bacterium]|nr:ATP synthase F1 subunit epsilon [Candidatus Daviesbacteria bacterium]